MFKCNINKTVVFLFRALIEDPEKLELEIDFYMPKVVSVGKFKGEGKIGRIPIMGKGVFNVTSCKYEINRNSST